jgi:hypothetical protein
MRVLTLLARHGTTKYPTALNDLRSFVAQRLDGISHEILVIENAPGAARGEPGVLQGSNRMWEFSAWDEGLAHLGGRLREFDLVHLVTSAFRTLYTRYIDRIDREVLEQIAGRGAALGHIDWYNEPVELLGYSAQAWIRSSFVFLPPIELTLLGPLAALATREVFFSGNPANPFREDAPISPNYRKYVLDWLTGAGTGQGVEWHSRFELSKGTLPFFEAKALTMLNEQLLAIRLRRQGCALVDATWLATELRRGARSLSRGFPSWQTQLTGRDTDAVTFPSLGA